MNRRTPFNGFWIFLLFLFVFGDTGFIPFAVLMAAVAFIMMRAVDTNRRTTTASNRKTNSYGYAERRAGNSHTSADLAKINVYLRKYFKARSQLSLPNNLDLVLRTNTYESMYSLDVYRNGSKIGTLNQFRQKYTDMYDEMFDILLAMAKNDQSAGKTEIVDAEIVDKDKRKDVKVDQTAKKPVMDSQYFINTINSLNDDIPDEDISNGLFQTSALLKQIQILEGKFPDSKSKLEKLYTYYIPILLRILKQYVNLQSAKFDPKYEKTKEDLKKTISLINGAMETITTQMTDNDFINISADISTLEAVLQKDGLVAENDMFSQMSMPKEGQR